MKDYKCKNCDRAVKKGYSKRNVYCSNKCQMDWQYKHVTVPMIEEGLKKTHGTAVRRYLTDKHGHKCSVCSTSEWMGEPIPLDIDHIDGNPVNNKGDNLRLICPNCHRQTSTWGNSAHKRMLREDDIFGRKILGV